MKKINLLSIVFLLLLMAMYSCGWETVPPTAKGKILTTSGYSLDVLVPGKYTLWGRDELVLLQTNTATYSESVKVILQDKLTITAHVKFRGRIAGSQDVINSMFNDITPGDDKIVQFMEVYNVYGRMAVRNKAREILSKYNVEDVHKNYARLSGEIKASLTKVLINTPLEISDIALGEIAYPKVVTDAVNMSKERQMSIEKEENQALIDMTKKKNELLLAEADYQIEITKAKAIRDKNKIIGEGVTPALIELRRLEVLEKMSENKAAVFMPVEGMTSIGAQIKMFK
ncbi:MAG: SPFH domain-containing protein [Candidatus Tenebribacter davisii]|nr:SPFH domain-containing protein [Candidatus Tenebribacter davisii]